MNQIHTNLKSPLGGKGNPKQKGDNNRRILTVLQMRKTTSLKRMEEKILT